MCEVSFGYLTVSLCYFVVFKSRVSQATVVDYFQFVIMCYFFYFVLYPEYAIELGGIYAEVIYKAFNVTEENLFSL